MLINRVLQPAGRGSLAEMQSWVALMAVLFGLSIESAIYHIANREQHPEPLPDKYITTISIGLACAGLASLILGGIAMLDVGLLSEQAVRLLWGMLLLLVLSMMSTILSTFLQAQDEIPFVAKLNVIQTVVSISYLGFGYVQGLITVPYTFLGLAVSQAPLVAMAGLHAWRGGLLRGVFRPALAKTMLHAGLQLHLATIATFVYTKVNQLIVNHYVGPHEAGLFAVGQNLAFTLMFIPMALQTALYPRVIHSEDDLEITVRSMRITFYGWGAIICVLMALAEPIILVYGGAAFLPAVPVFRLCLGATLFLSVSSQLAPLFIKRGAFGIATVSAITLGIISVGLNFVLVPPKGALGASLATALTTFLGFIGTLFFFRYLSGVSPLVIFRLNIKRFMHVKTR